MEQERLTPTIFYMSVIEKKSFQLNYIKSIKHIIQKADLTFEII